MEEHMTSPQSNDDKPGCADDPAFAKVAQSEKRWIRKRRVIASHKFNPVRHLRNAPSESKFPPGVDSLKQWYAHLERIVDGYRGPAESYEPCAGKKEPFRTVGLGFSGGGIRSATFNLGLLQALEKYGQLDMFDYLSTVSGGGYIGASLAWFRTVTKSTAFPFGTRRSDCSMDGGGGVLAWFRAHGNYLTPGNMLNVWTLVAAILTGTLLSLVVIASSVFTIMWGLSKSIARVPLERSILYAGIAFLLIFLGLVLVFALLSSARLMRTATIQTASQVMKGFTLRLGVCLIVVGSIPMVYEIVHSHIEEWQKWIMTSVVAGGGGGLAGGLFASKSSTQNGKGAGLLIYAGLTLLVYGLFLWSWHVMNYYRDLPLPLWLQGGLAISLLIGLFAKINHVSMHRFYRDRLMDAYMPFKVAKVSSRDADQCRMADICPDTGTPFPIINTTLQTINSKNAMLEQRGGENFIFSPKYCGSSHTAWIKTDKYLNGNMNLATAMAVSGAAVDANASVTRNRSLSFVMSLLNLRLGYWTVNPRSYRFWFLPPLANVGFLKGLFCDLLGQGLSEKQQLVHLSDGGHFENLGLYELLRRKCSIIVISDAGADKDRTFSDLAKVISMARIDFGAAISIPQSKLKALVPDSENRLSAKAFVRGKIKYQPDFKDGKKIPRRGILYYIKPSIIKKLPADITGYFNAHVDFPHQSTADQFFDERQFEAYRELGYCIGKKFCKQFEKDIQGNFEKEEKKKDAANKSEDSASSIPTR